MNERMRTVLRIGQITILAAVVSLATGCKSGLEEENALLTQANMELREDRDRLEKALEDSERERGLYESQMLAANAEADSLRNRSGDIGAPTGFEGIAQVGSGRTRPGEVVVEIAGDVLFDSGSNTLKSTAKRSLDRVASVINDRYSGALIRIEGYTDSDPIRKSKWETNERLSAERAMAVERYLVSKSVSNDRVYSAAFGPARPKGNKSQSRRVEIVILEATY